MNSKKSRLILYVKPNELLLIREADLKLWTLSFENAVVNYQEILDPLAYKKKLDTFIQGLKKEGIGPGSVTLLLSSEMVYVKDFEPATAPELIKEEVGSFIDELPFENDLILLNKIDTNKGLKVYGVNKSLFCSFIDAFKSIGLTLEWVLPEFLYFATTPKLDAKLFSTIYIDPRLNSDANISCADHAISNLESLGLGSDEVCVPMSLGVLKTDPTAFFFHMLSKNCRSQYLFKFLLVGNIFIVIGVASWFSYKSFFAQGANGSLKPVTSYNYELELSRQATSSSQNSMKIPLNVYYAEKNLAVSAVISGINDEGGFEVAENVLSDTTGHTITQLYVPQNTSSDVSDKLGNILVKYVVNYEIINLEEDSANSADLGLSDSTKLNLYITQ